MTRSDPIASATLAKLYVDQGHLSRAAKIIDAVLANDPFQGAALVLRERLRVRPIASVSCDFRDGELQVRWHKVKSGDEVHLWVKIITADQSGRLHTADHDYSCDQSNGSKRIPIDAARGSAAVCLARGRSRVPLAIAAPVSWSDSAG